MKKNKSLLEQGELRRRAEEALREQTSAFPPRTGDETQKLIHELQVHQIELEMQNDDLRHARTELEAALEKYTDLYDFAPVGYMTLDHEGVIRGSNLTAARLLGLVRSQLIGRHFGQFVAARARPVFQAFHRRALASQSTESCEVDLPGSNKEPLFLRMEGAASAEGQSCRVAIVDVTERKRREEEIRRLNADLERHVCELEVLNDELDAFSHTVSHDLRSPLTVIRIYCHMVQKKCGERLDEQCRGYLLQIDQGVESMNELINTLLNFSCVTHSELQSEQIDLSAIAEAVAVELGREDPGRRASFSIAPGVSVRGDAKLLRVALQNLLGNAWKYTGRKEEAVIEFGAKEVAGKTVCFVRDNGVGFDGAHAVMLFKAFQRLPGGEEFSGFGLGLATVQRIIQLHGGRVWAEGAPGKGATFYFTLA